MGETPRSGLNGNGVRLVSNGDVMNESNHLVQGLGEISVRIHDVSLSPTGDAAARYNLAHPV
jgi:hypothetical protein